MSATTESKRIQLRMSGLAKLIYIPTALLSLVFALYALKLLLMLGIIESCISNVLMEP
jgi:hypothetical protein